MKGVSCSATEIFTVCLLLGLSWSFPTAHADSESEEETSKSTEDVQEAPDTPNKLLVIQLDGFRWDYYDRQKNELRGFSQFLSEGVQAKWVEPVFPSLSYPSWTTISTGVYPETHGIIGNYMYDLRNNAVFDLSNHTTTSMVDWWQNSEPIWTTATRYFKKCFLRFWSRCDVTVNDIRVETCTGYHVARGVRAIEDTLKIAVEKLQSDFDLVMVYGEHIDNVGHEFGPESPDLKQAVRDVDNVLYDFLDLMVDADLDDKVNIIILSDHGMKWTGEGSGVIYVGLDDYLDKNDVFKVLDRGAVLSIAPYSKRVEDVYRMLQGKEGFDVYMRENIPDEFHYKKARLVQDILVVAKPNYFVQGLQSSNQIPLDPVTYKHWGGVHGYPNMTEMRSIFFAKGPDFKKGIVHPPIELVDIYQIFAKLLDIPPQPHNGSWERVAGMMLNKAITFPSSFFFILFSLALSLFATSTNVLLPISSY